MGDLKGVYENRPSSGILRDDSRGCAPVLWAVLLVLALMLLVDPVDGLKAQVQKPPVIVSSQGINEGSFSFWRKNCEKNKELQENIFDILQDQVKHLETMAERTQKNIERFKPRTGSTEYIRAAHALIIKESLRSLGRICSAEILLKKCPGLSKALNALDNLINNKLASKTNAEFVDWLRNRKNEALVEETLNKVGDRLQKYIVEFGGKRAKLAGRLAGGAGMAIVVTQEALELREGLRIVEDKQTYNEIVSNYRRFKSNVEIRLREKEEELKRTKLLIEGYKRALDPYNVKNSIGAIKTVVSNKGVSPEEVFKNAPVGDEESVLQLTEAARQVLVKPEVRKQLENVGGVCLDVTFDLLSFLGIPSKGQPKRPIVTVESPVLISLKKLYAKLKPHQESARRWSDLPDELRYPGRIGCIHGFMLEEQSEDVILIGSSVPRGKGIDIDNLVVGLRYVWAEGITPGVSLDPNPRNLGGPQYVRVIGILATSSFA